MNKLSIKFKVLFVLLLLTTIMIVAMTFSMQSGFNKGFFNYRKALDKQFNDSLIKSLVGYYSENSTWDGLIDNRHEWNGIVSQSSANPESGNRGHRQHRDRPPIRKHPRGRLPPQRKWQKNDKAR